MKVVLRNEQLVFDCNTTEVEKIKEHLTFENPAYKNAKRFSRSRYISISPYLTYYTTKFIVIDKDKTKVLAIPIGVDLQSLFPDKEITYIEERINIQTDYPKFLLDMRTDQLRAYQHYFNSIKHPTKNPSIVQLPTGKGKSILALYIAWILRAKTLILVHKDDLVVGWNKDIKLCFGEDIKTGLIKAKSRTVGKQFTIATVQTLSRMSEEELKTYTSQFSFVVQDELHHLGLNIFNIINSFNSRFKLGLSATPYRTDGLNFVFDIFFGGLCYKHEVTENDEDICNAEVRTLYSPYRYKPFITKDGVFNKYDYSEKVLPDNIKYLEDLPYDDRPSIPYLTIDNASVTGRQTKIMVCNKILEEYREGHSIIALFTQKEHINIYYRYLCRYIPKDHILLYYGDNKESSEELMKKAENKEALITLATYAKATEGTNVKSWEVEFLVSSINNSKNVEQATGRIRRRKEGKLNPVRVYDVCYDKCYGFYKHYNTRVNTYKRLKYKITDPKVTSNSFFNRGYLTK